MSDAFEALDISDYPLILDNKEVHVWRASLAQSDDIVAQYEYVISEHEKEKASQFKFIKHRNQYIITRGVLRHILAGYLDAKPAALEFQYGEHGKPFLNDHQNSINIKFNLSHSGELVLFAMSIDCELGIDVEFIPTERSVNDIAERFFTPNEVNQINELPEEKQREAFFDCWTLKEAYLKGAGSGLSSGLSRFSVDFTSNNSPCFLNMEDCTDEPTQWSLRRLNPGQGYIASLAVAQHDWRLECRQWDHAHCL